MEMLNRIDGGPDTGNITIYEAFLAIPRRRAGGECHLLQHGTILTRARTTPTLPDRLGAGRRLLDLPGLLRIGTADSLKSSRRDIVPSYAHRSEANTHAGQTAEPVGRTATSFHSVKASAESKTTWLELQVSPSRPVLTQLWADIAPNRSIGVCGNPPPPSAPTSAEPPSAANSRYITPTHATSWFCYSQPSGLNEAFLKLLFEPCGPANSS